MSKHDEVKIRSRVPFRLVPRPELSVQADLVSFANLRSGREHIAIVAGAPTQNCLVRVHSECLTGDVLGSSRCDCGAQLLEAMELIGRDGGVILYMRQEGRGIGLYRKLEAYLLQDRGADTFAANLALGRAADERDYSECADMLRALGLTSVRLITNNPEKVRSLKRHGVDVVGTRATGVHLTPENAQYLSDKAAIAGHGITVSGGRG